MPVPGAEVNTQDVPSPSGSVTDTGVAFFLGETERGPLDPTEVFSYGMVEDSHGERQPWGVLHDVAKNAFDTGLARGFVVRVLSRTATTSTIALSAASGSAGSLAATTPGAWGNTLRRDVLNMGGGRVRIRITDADGLFLEQSPASATVDGLLQWSDDDAKYVKYTPGAGGLPVATTSTAALTGGLDNRGSIDIDDWSAAIARITAEHGVGQIVAPGISDEDLQLLLLEKGADTVCQRFAPLDADPTWTVEQILSHAAALRAGGNGAFGTLIVPRIRVNAPGNGTRWIPASGFWAGRAAFTDATAGVAQPPGGDLYGQSRQVLDVERTFTDDERDRLNEAGVIVIARVAKAPRIYGARTLADTKEHPAYKWVTGTRGVIRFRALGLQVLEQRVLRRVDGARTILVSLSNDLHSLGEQERTGPTPSLYGETAEEAYTFDTRYPTVNSQASLAAGFVIANGEIRVGPVAERVPLNLTVRSPADQITAA